jgi:YbgC/YbaW family acyl-CoA thioester hydrolase
MAASEFRTTRRVEFVETDMAGIAHFTNFFRYMEEAEHAFLRSLGVSVMHKTEDGVIGWPRVNVACEFFKPAVFEDVVEIVVRVEKKSPKALTYLISFYKDGAEIARGRSTAVCCLVRPGRKIESIAVPPFLADKLAECTALPPPPVRGK